MRHTARADPPTAGGGGRAAGTGAGRRPAGPPRRRLIAAVATLALGLGMAAMLSQQRPTGADEPPAARPLTGEEAHRLAGMRAANHDDARAGVRATLTDGQRTVRFTGWIDWRHPMTYLAQHQPGGGEPATLIQAVPGLVALHEPAPTRASRAGSATSPGPADQADRLPPATPPSERWRVHHLGAAGAPGTAAEPGSLDALLTLLLTTTAEQPDAAELLAASDARWLRHDRTAGHELDVLLGPAIPPAAARPELAAGAANRSLAAMGGAVRYWLDRAGRLHRLEARLSEQTGVRVDFDRADHTAVEVIDVLGGAAVDPRPVTASQAQTLAELRLRNRQATGGQVRLRLPGPAGAHVHAAGWLDWREPLGYLASYRDGVPTGLLLADGAGVATRADLPPRAGMPPLPVPTDPGWRWLPWQERGDDHGGYDLDLLINEALSWSAWQVDDLEQVRQTARWLRTDRLAGTAVNVYEIPRPVEAQAAPGQARLRYWVGEQSGTLLRLEIRTRDGGWGQLDLLPGTSPPPLR